MGAARLNADVVVESRARLGEGPIWDDRREQLFFVDIEGESVHCFDPSRAVHSSFPVGRTVGAVALREDGGLVLAAHDGFFLVEPRGEDLRPHGELRVDSQLVRFNDGKVDPRGRFLAGTMHWEQQRPVGALYVLEPDGTARVLLESVTISNGLAWRGDGAVVYYIDTAQGCVEAFDYDIERVELSNRRSIVRMESGSPDGMTIDDDGCLWVAVWGGSRVERINPVTGELLSVVKLPVSQVTSVAFGGAGRDVLYITTARRGLGAEALGREPHAGDLFAVEPGVTGPPAHRYAWSSSQGERSSGA